MVCIIQVVNAVVGDNIVKNVAVVVNVVKDIVAVVVFTACNVRLGYLYCLLSNFVQIDTAVG